MLTDGQGLDRPRVTLHARGEHRHAVGEDERLGRRNAWESLHGHPAGAVGLERVALALVLAPQVHDETREEDPEDIEHDLSHVDVIGDCASSSVHYGLLCTKFE